jgi:DNA-binding SARP family transcriptional activator
MLKVKLFGSGEARYCDRPLAGFPHQQSYRLLCYLLLNRHTRHNREELAAVFWSEQPTYYARKNLRNTLWRLRKALQSTGADAYQFLSIGNNTISFKRPSPYWCDVEEFENTLIRYQELSGADLNPAQVTHVEEAIMLYEGNHLLAGIYNDWCLVHQDRLHLMYLNALHKLMIYYESNGTPEHGLAYGQRILTCDDISEKTHRSMMRLYWQQGNQSAALAQYKRCAQILQEKLGVLPMARTRRLYQQMVSNQFDLVNRTGLDDAPPSISPGGGSATHQSPEAYALEKLNRLQVVLAETRAELHRVEQLISTRLADSDR